MIRISRGLPRVASAVLSATVTLASVVVLVLLVCALVTSFYVPMVSDEVSTKLTNARVFEEHGMFVHLLPMCRSSWVQPIPTTLYPGAVLVTLAYGHLGLVGWKLTGIVASLLVVAGVARLAWEGVATRTDRVVVAAGLSAISCLGVVPFVLVMSRPEQPMKLCVLAYAALPWLGRRWAGRPRGLAALGVAFFLVTSLFFYAHPKALFYLPYVLTVAVLTAPPGRRRLFSAVVVPYVLLVAYQCYLFSVDVVRCDESPEVSRFFGDLSLSPRALFASPAAFLRAGLHNLLETPSRLWKEVVFAANNDGWVPLPRLERLPPDVRDLNERTEPVFLALFALTPLLLLVAYRRTREAREAIAVGVTLVLGLAANVFFYNVIPFYNATLIVPALSVACALAVAADPRPLLPERLRPAGRAVLLAFLVVAAQNLVALVSTFGPTLYENARRVGPKVPGQSLAVPVLGYDVERPKIRELARSCGIDGDGARRLVVDDYTFLAFEHLREPIHMLYVTDVLPLLGKPLAGEKVRVFLRDLESPGIVGRCWLFPKALRPKARTLESYCCVGADAFVDGVAR